MADHHAPSGKKHFGTREYVIVAVILAVMTSVEVAIYYVEPLRPILGPLLLTLATIKFAAVGMFFMHLYFDSRLFSSFFVGGILLAGTLMIALLALFSNLFV